MSKKTKKNKSRVKVQTTAPVTAAVNANNTVTLMPGRVPLKQAPVKSQLSEAELKNRYSYVTGELRIISLIAGFIFLTLIGLSFVIN